MVRNSRTSERDYTKIRNITANMSLSKMSAIIEDIIRAMGAVAIMKTYSAEGKVNGFIFSVASEEDKGRVLNISIPVEVEPVEQYLLSQVKSSRKRVTSRGSKSLKEQAEKTAWKLLLEWLHIQYTMSIAKRIPLVQIFLGYTYNPVTKETFYNRLARENFKLLGQ